MSRKKDVLLTPDEIALALMVTTRTVYTWLRTGRLQAYRAGRQWRVSTSDLQSFMRPNAQPALEPEKESQQ